AVHRREAIDAEPVDQVEAEHVAVFGRERLQRLAKGVAEGAGIGSAEHLELGARVHRRRAGEELVVRELRRSAVLAALHREAHPRDENAKPRAERTLAGVLRDLGHATAVRKKELLAHALAEV